MEYKFSDKLAALKPSAIREIFKSLTDPNIISFAAGNPSPESFPADDMAKIAADIFAHDAAFSLQYGITEGYKPLRDAVTARCRDKFGIGRESDMTIIVSGGQQGIELACKALCNEGDAVVTENPTFIGGLNAFRSNGVRTIGVPMRADGIDPDELDKTLTENPGVRLMYIIPTFQNPTGITSTAETRRRVYDVARAHGVMIFEDNPYGELRFSGEDVPTLKSMDEDGIVIYCSSFSKILSAGMRVGYIIAPEPVVQKMVVAKQSEDVHTNLFFQMLVYKYMAEHDLDAHIAEIRALYRGKCALMLGELEKALPEGWEFTRPQGGLFVWVTAPEGVDMGAFVKRCLAAGVAVVPGATFNADAADTQSRSVRLNYSTPSDEEIVKGCAALGRAAREQMTER